MEGATQELIVEPRMEIPQISILKCDQIPGASGDHFRLTETSSNDASDPSSMLSMKSYSMMGAQPSMSDHNRLHITTEGVSLALSRNHQGTRSSASHILAAEGAGPSQEGQPSTSDGRNRGPPSSPAEGADQDGGSPRRSFHEFLPLLLFAIGTITILRIAAHRGKIPKN